MTELNRVSYSREMRERAKEEGKGLVTIEVVSEEGTRLTLQGPATEAQREKAWAVFMELWTEFDQ